jgi:ubiquinone/menaquinone biosynthesis C-methylase UbiE
MSLGDRFFAVMYDRMLAKTEQACMQGHRRSLLADVRGDVLEIGGGTGANLPYYGDGIATLTLTEPSQPMISRLQRHVDELGMAAKVLRAPAEDLPFEDDSFDVVVCTLVLCGVGDQPRALRELRRVLRPGGRLVFVEHVRSDEPRLARFQDRMNWLNKLMVKCECNRSTLDSILAAGFTTTQLEHGTLEKAAPWDRPLIWGVADANTASAPVAANAAAADAG